MANPEFTEIKAPDLQFVADGKPHKVSEVYKVLSKHYIRTEEERNVIC